jgi:AcrR family transcriptional regulator
MQQPSGPKWRRRKGERPGEILAAAQALFAERGYAATRLDEIAARAGVSKGALYLYFPTKQDLFRAVVIAAAAPNLEMAKAAAERFDSDFPGFVRLFLPALAHAAAETSLGAVAKMVIAESRNFPELAQVWHEAVASKALALVTGLIAAAQARGEVRPGDPAAFAVGLVAPIVLGMIWRETFVPIGAAPFDLDGIARQHAETAIAGMAPHARPL